MKKIVLTSIAIMTVISAHRAAGIARAAELTLAEDGRTKYSIVIAAEAEEGEKYAADELALFLGRMTGADFPITRDSEPAGDFEIVVGHTNRKSLEDLPANLRTENFEGFAIVPDGERLVIIGNIPRGTLYGVYDFLDVELGVLFLDHHVDHVPQRATLKVTVNARTYGPPIERRANYAALMGTAALRNRMNSIGFQVIAEKMLGGVKKVGHPIHTMNVLVPREKYFDEHPEYFPFIDGERREEYKGMITQQCFTNPDVLLIVMNKVREWVRDGLKSNPYNKVIASVSANDSIHFCECEPCKAVAREDGSEDDHGAGAAHLRMVNAIARQIAIEFPNASISTMLYHSKMPKKIKPVKNVIMNMVSGIDWRYRLDDPTSKNNVIMSKTLAEWTQKVGEGRIYNWSKHVNFGDFLKPIPNLREIATNVRIYHEKYRLGGMFAQNQQTRGGEMRVLRHYLLARAMWRPTVDSRETIKEFCHAFYGDGAEGVLRYINYLHDEWGDRLDKGTGSNLSLLYQLGFGPEDTQRFVTESERILSAAEDAASTAETKRRVAVCRLPMWNIMLTRAYSREGNVLTLPDEWHFKFDAEPDEQDVGLTEQWQNTTDLSSWRMMRTNTHWTLQDVEDRRGTAWYGIQFDLPDTGSAPLAIFFASVDGFTDIFLDGEKIGEQQLSAQAMWNRGFFIPVNDGLAPGRHTLILRVQKNYANAGMWRRVSIVDMSTPISDELRTAGGRFIEVARSARLGQLGENYDKPFAQTEMNHYPTIRFFLRHGDPLEKSNPWVWPDGDLSRIGDTAAVTELNLSGRMVNDEKLQPVATMKSLQRLEMRFLLKRVTAQGMGHLAGLKNLKHLDLWHTEIGNDGVKHLAGLKSLETLNLKKVGINDAGLAHLAGLESLRELTIASNKITDAGLKHLKSLSNLSVLYVGDSPLLDYRSHQPGPGGAALVQALPNLQIKR